MKQLKEIYWGLDLKLTAEEMENAIKSGLNETSTRLHGK